MYSQLNNIISSINKAEPNILVITGNLIEEELGLKTIDCDNYLDSLLIESCLNYSNLLNYPENVWQYVHQKQKEVKDITKSPSHESLNVLIESFPELYIVTQNIYGLYKKFGVKNRLIELYGNIFNSKVLRDFNSSNVYHWSIPHNQKGQVLRPNITLFEEDFDHNKYIYTLGLAFQADLIITIGVGQSDAFLMNLPLTAHQYKIPLIEISPSPIYGKLPTLTIKERISMILPIFTTSLIEIQEHHTKKLIQQKT